MESSNPIRNSASLLAVNNMSQYGTQYMPARTTPGPISSPSNVPIASQTSSQTVAQNFPTLTGSIQPPVPSMTYMAADMNRQTTNFHPTNSVQTLGTTQQQLPVQSSNILNTDHSYHGSEMNPGPTVPVPEYSTSQSSQSSPLAEMLFSAPETHQPRDEPSVTNSTSQDINAKRKDALEGLTQCCETLERLEVEVACIVHHGGEVHTCGTRKGLTFLQDEVYIKKFFQKFLDGHKPKYFLAKDGKTTKAGASNTNLSDVDPSCKMEDDHQSDNEEADQECNEENKNITIEAAEVKTEAKEVPYATRSSLRRKSKQKISTKAAKKRKLKTRTDGKKVQAKKAKVMEKDKLSTTTPKSEDVERDNIDNEIDKYKSTGTHCCGVCKKQFGTNKKLRRHESRCTKTKFFCSMCNEECKNRKALTSHERNHKTQDGILARHCVQCVISFKSKSELHDHVLFAHGSYKPFFCVTCSNYYSSHQALKAHQRHVHNAVEPTMACDKCERRFHSQVELKRHQLRTHLPKQFHCEICGMTFPLIYDLESHQKNRHQEKPREECNICGKTFTMLRSLKEHIDVVHATTKDYVCEICGFATSSPDNLRTHKYTHIGKPFTCDQCSEGFLVKRELQDHVAYFHEGVRKYTCHICNRTDFWCWRQLSRHQSGTHGDRKYMCSYCPKMFKSQKMLDHHTNIHTGAKPYKCTVCTTSFNQPGNLHRHMKVHTVDGSKPYPCHLCDNAFTQAANLKKHLLLHDQVEPSQSLMYTG